jgi:hypothetical protein
MSQSFILLNSMQGSLNYLTGVIQQAAAMPSPEVNIAGATELVQQQESLSQLQQLSIASLFGEKPNLASVYLNVTPENHPMWLEMEYWKHFGTTAS